jgi:hypothetical protein
LIPVVAVPCSARRGRSVRAVEGVVRRWLEVRREERSRSSKVLSVEGGC